MSITIAFNSFLLHADEQQQRVVSGVITDNKTGDPLTGVNVVLRGTATGTNTDIECLFARAYSGTRDITNTGLTAGTKYYFRASARTYAPGNYYNYSETFTSQPY